MNPVATARTLASPAVSAPRRIRPRRSSLGDDLFQVVVAGGDLRAGIAKVVALLRRDGAVEGLEWWVPAADGGSLRMELSCGDAAGRRAAVSVGAAGTVVLVGDTAAWVEPAVAGLRPLLHHWWTSEQLAEHASLLARRNAALEDFAALLAHDVKSALVSALRGEAPGEGLLRALELVDSILQAARVEAADGGVAALADIVREAVADLGEVSVEVITSVTGVMPIPSASLRFVLRNLLGNAVAAGARTIHVSALAQEGRRVLAVADDGVGLGSSQGYASGAQLGLVLCRRLLARVGATLTLRRRGVVGTCAVISFTGTPE